eukprot:13906574-Alexandrium_andersonii.AAC.1
MQSSLCALDASLCRACAPVRPVNSSAPDIARLALFTLLSPRSEQLDRLANGFGIPDLPAQFAE